MRMFLQLDPLADKALENWATITVNSEVITWESSNDLCTFYRSQPTNSYEDLSISPTYYPDPPPPAAAVIDVIPPTPTSVASEAPPLCVRCNCDIQKQENTKLEQTVHQESDNHPVSVIQPASNVNKESRICDGSEIIANLSTSTSSLNCQSDKTFIIKPLLKDLEIDKGNVDQTTIKTCNLAEKSIVSLPLAKTSTSVAATSTTQLHRSQLCSTAVSVSSHSTIKQHARTADSSSQIHQSTTPSSRPSTPYKPVIKQQRKDHITDGGSNPKQKIWGISTIQPKTSKNSVPYSQKQRKSSSSEATLCASVGNNTNTTSNLGRTGQTTPLALQVKTITPDKSDNSSNLNTYPLKKHPLINIKSGSVIQIDSSSLGSSKSKVVHMRYNIVVFFTILEI